MNDEEFITYLKEKAWSFQFGERLSVEDSMRLIDMMHETSRGSVGYRTPCMLLTAYIKRAELAAARVAKARLLI